MATLCLLFIAIYGQMSTESAFHKGYFGDPLPTGALRRYGTTRWRHPDEIVGMWFGPDDRTVVTVCWDGGVRRYSYPDGRLLEHSGSPGNEFYCAATTSDATRFAVGGLDSILRVWSNTEQRPLFAEEQVTWIQSVAIADDGTMVAAGTEDGVQVWDVRAHKLLYQHENDYGAASVLFGRDRQDLLIGFGNGEIVRLDLASGHTRMRWNISDARITSMIVDPNSGDPFVGTVNKSAKIIRLKTDGTTSDIVNLPRIRKYDNALACLTTDRTRLVAAVSSTLCVCDLSGKVISKTNLPNAIRSITMSRSGKVVGTASYWEHAPRFLLTESLETIPETAKYLDSAGQLAGIDGLAVVHNRIISDGANDKVYTWGAADGQLHEARDSVLHSAVSGGSGMRVISLAGRPAKSIVAWDSRTGIEIYEISPGYDHIRRAAECGDCVVVLSGDGRLSVWGTASSERIWEQRVYEKSDPLWHGDFIVHDRRWIITSDDRSRVSIWAIPNGELKADLRTDRIMELASSGKTLVGITREGLLRVWDLETLALMKTISTGHNNISSVAISPAGQVAIGHSDSSLTVWTLSSGVRSYDLIGHRGSVSRSMFLDSDRLLTGSQDTTILLWDLSLLK